MPLVEDAELAPDDLYGTLKAEAEWEASRVPSVVAPADQRLRPRLGIVLKRDVIGHFVRAVQEGRAAQHVRRRLPGDRLRPRRRRLPRGRGRSSRLPRPRTAAVVLNVGSGARRLDPEPRGRLRAGGARARSDASVGVVTEPAPRGQDLAGPLGLDRSPDGPLPVVPRRRPSARASKSSSRPRRSPETITMARIQVAKPYFPAEDIDEILRERPRRPRERHAHAGAVRAASSRRRSPPTAARATPAPSTRAPRRCRGSSTTTTSATARC